MRRGCGPTALALCINITVLCIFVNERALAIILALSSRRPIILMVLKGGAAMTTFLLFLPLLAVVWYLCTGRSGLFAQHHVGYHTGVSAIDHPALEAFREKS